MKLTVPAILFSTGFLLGAPLLYAQETPEEPAAPETAAGGDPIEILSGTAATWGVTGDDFMKALRRSRPEWLDAGKGRARIGNIVLGDTGKPHVIMGGKLPVYETLVNFDSGTLRRVEVSLYNRGDAGEISPDKFKTRIEEARKAISAVAGNDGEDRGKVRGAVLTEGWIWKNDESQYLLESSMKRQRGDDRPEFLRLVIVPSSSVPKRALGSSDNGKCGAATATLSALKAPVIKTPEGDVYIANVPMVDQGQKGYCVVATAERVMLYFGAKVDQHAMAQLADSSAGGGTSPEKMTEALDKIDSKFDLRLKRIMPWTVRGYLDMIKDYNRAARSAKEPQISDSEAYSVGSAYQKMDAETLKKARSTSSAMNKFMKVLHSYIDMGVPLMWSVQLGLFKEGDLPQSGGGHMRLIIGYNEESKEILFSDSWGAGHELKRMNAEEAWAITSGIYGMEPKNK